MHYVVRCLFLMHCKLMKPSGIFIPRIMSPLTGVPICFSSFPGVSPRCGSTSGLPYGAPTGLEVRLAFGSHPHNLIFVEFLVMPKLSLLPAP